MCPDVSVIIPSYNHAHYLNFAIKSVLSQTYNDWEAIVVDDGSSDNTHDVTAQFNDPRIRYIYQDNQGLSSARNTGIYASLADVIALLDADDIWEEDFLEKMLPTIERHPEAAAVYCGHKYIDGEGNIVGSPVLKIVPPDEFRIHIFCRGNWLVPSAVVFRKKIAEVEGYFDESLQAMEDTDLWLKISDHESFIGVPQVLVRYRQHDSNMSREPRRMIAAYYQILERYHGPPKGDPSSWTDKKKQAYARYYRSASTRYLAIGDIKLSAYYFLRMFDVNPEAGFEMGVWRGLARANLPLEMRHEPHPLDWESSERDLKAIHSELERMGRNSSLIENNLTNFSASAYLALSDEAFREKDLSRAFFWYWKALRHRFRLLISRPFWGTLARGVFRKV